MLQVYKHCKPDLNWKSPPEENTGTSVQDCHSLGDQTRHCCPLAQMAAEETNQFCFLSLDYVWK